MQFKTYSILLPQKFIRFYIDGVPHSVGVVQLKLHSKEDRLSRLSATSPASLEINTVEMFAQANDLQQPITALTSTGQLILPIANDSDEEMIVKKNKRIGTINIIAPLSHKNFQSKFPEKITNMHIMEYVMIISICSHNSRFYNSIDI